MPAVASLACFVLALSAQAPQSAHDAEAINHCDSIIIDSTRSALELLRAARANHVNERGGTTSLVYEGTLAVEAHMMRPGMTWTRPVRLEMVFAPDASALALRETVNPSKSPSVERVIIDRARVALQKAADQPFLEQSDEQASILRADIACWLPGPAVDAAHAAAASVRVGAALQRHGARLVPVSFADAAGRCSTLLLDAQGRVVRIERLASHARLGDVCHWTDFADWIERDGATAPRRVSRFIVQGSTTVRYDLELSDGAAPAEPQPFVLPAERQTDIPDWGQSVSPMQGFELVELAESLWAMEVSAADQRVVVIERADDLVLLGAPDGDAVCGDLLRALGHRFPGKPIATVAFSHHHPASAGGLRVLAARGASIIAPRALEPFVRHHLARPTSLGSPVVPGSEHPKLTLFEEQTTIDAGPNTVRLIDIAEHSAHAFSYVVFHFPEHGLLFEDDLGHFPANGAARVNPRLMGLAGRLEALKIQPTRLIQGWPVKGVLREVAWADVAAMIEAERNKAAPAQ